VAVHVDDVVEVSRPAPLGERPELLGKQLGDRVTQHAVHRERRIAKLYARQVIGERLAIVEPPVLQIGQGRAEVPDGAGDGAGGGGLARAAVRY
jgi:hypothetical protein